MRQWKVYKLLFTLVAQSHLGLLIAVCKFLLLLPACCFGDWYVASWNSLKLQLAGQLYNVTPDDKNSLTLNKHLMKFSQTENFSLSQIPPANLYRVVGLWKLARSRYRGSHEVPRVLFSFVDSRISLTNSSARIRCKRNRGPAWLW